MNCTICVRGVCGEPQPKGERAMHDYSDLPVMNMDDNETGCCPRFDPSPWDDKVFNLDKLKFARNYTKSIFHIPINMGKIMTESMNLITGANAQTKEGYLILSREHSSWKAEHNFLVTQDIPQMEMTELPGSYYARVYEGPYKDEPKWMKDFEKQAGEKGLKLNAIYAFYTTCPKCAKHYGKNYVVLMGKISE